MTIKEPYQECVKLRNRRSGGVSAARGILFFAPLKSCKTVVRAWKEPKRVNSPILRTVSQFAFGSWPSGLYDGVQMRRNGFPGRF